MAKAKIIKEKVLVEMQFSFSLLANSTGVDIQQLQPSIIRQAWIFFAVILKGQDLFTSR